MLAIFSKGKYIASTNTFHMLAMTSEKTPKRAAGGRAVAKKMTDEERQARAKKGAIARWGLKATHEGLLKFGDIEVPCYVLEDGRRVLSLAG